MVKVKQQHVRNETDDEPGRRFQDSFKSRGHEKRIALFLLSVLDRKRLHP
jgi:hypothetical protein